MRKHIVDEIRRLAEAKDGQPPGKLMFARQTGIREHQWSGVLWARWSDALAEAGYEGNTLQGRFDTSDVLTKIIEACRHYGRITTVSEMKLYQRNDLDFPSKGAIASHFPTKVELFAAVAQRASQGAAFRDIAAMLPGERKGDTSYRARGPKISEGYVYLLKSGNYYKISQSNDLERCVKKIWLALPDAATSYQLPHALTAFAHVRDAMEVMSSGWATRSFQARQQTSTIVR